MLGDTKSEWNKALKNSENLKNLQTPVKVGGTLAAILIELDRILSVCLLWSI